MTAITNYKAEFVERTKQLINNHFSNLEPHNLEVTLLLNCLLGLIITVSENKIKCFNAKIDLEFSNYIPEKIGFLIKNEGQVNQDLIKESSIKTNVGHKPMLKEMTKSWFLNKLRNGIAHQNIEVQNEGNLLAGLKLWNAPPKQPIDFEIIFTIDELKALAIKIADDYLTKNAN